MAITVTFRAAGTDATTYTAGAPGDFTAVFGTMYRTAVGPKLTGETAAGGRGVSLDFRPTVGSNNAAQHTWTVSGNAAARGGYSEFYYFKKLIANGAAAVFLGQTNRASGAVAVFQTKGKPPTNGNFWYSRTVTYTDTDSGVAIPLKQWFELRQTWEWSGLVVNLKVAYRLAGTTDWVTIYANAALTADVAINQVIGGMPNSSHANSSFLGRWGMPCLFEMSSLADRDSLIPGQEDPPTTAGEVWVNPATGNDANYGNTEAGAWASVTPLNTANRYGGIIPGDTIYMDSRTTAIDPGTAVIEFATDDITIDFLNTAPKLHKDVSGATAGGPTTWTQYDATNFPRIWTTTDGGATDKHGSVIWEDDKWMDKAHGAAITDVRTTMNSNAGGHGFFYSDATNLYLVASDNSNPNTNGKLYHRSRNRVAVIGEATAANSGASAIQVIHSANVLLKNLYAPNAKTTLAAAATGDAYTGYIVQFGSGLTGTLNEIRDSTLGKWSKHANARTGSGTGVYLTRTRVTYLPGTRYAGVGGQTADVDYATAGALNRGYYNGVICDANAGSLGSTGGYEEVAYPFWTTHGTIGSPDDEFDYFEFRNCRLCSTLLEQGVTDDGIIRLINTTGYDSISEGNATLEILTTADKRPVSKGALLGLAKALKALNHRGADRPRNPLRGKVLRVRRAKRRF